MIHDWLEFIYDYTLSEVDFFLRFLLIILIGVPFIKFMGDMIERLIAQYYSSQAGMLAKKAIQYGVSILMALMILDHFGFSLGPLLGAAGILGIGFGFAAKESLSNFISGLFLIWERPFVVGDLLQVDLERGVVHSVDLLSVKLLKLDNTFLRIPNAHLMNSVFINITHFQIRRYDFVVGVTYDNNIKDVLDLLADVANKNLYVLNEPEPRIMFKQFGPSSLDFDIGVWFEKEDFKAIKNSINHEIKLRLEQEGVEIAFPHLTLYSGKHSGPFEIQQVTPFTDSNKTREEHSRLGEALLDPSEAYKTDAYTAAPLGPDSTKLEDEIKE